MVMAFGAVVEVDGMAGIVPYGCCRLSYGSNCRRCCYYPGENVDAHADVEPRY